MKDLQREILSLVASGKITAAEGAARLESLAGGASPAVAELPSRPPAQPMLALTGRQVKVMSQFGSADIVGDASVSFAVAEGPHRARQEGDTMVIEHAPFGDGDDTFSFGQGGRRVVVNGTDFQRRRALTVRMNPELALLATVQAGSVRIEGVHGPITADIQAGNCKVRDFRGPLNVVAQAGNVVASGRLDIGASKIRCEMGSVQINLEKGSSVRIMARTTFGKVGIEDGNVPVVGQSGKDVTIGGGAATLDVECTMGNVRVSAE